MTCAKKVVVCQIRTPDGKWFEGDNSCALPQKTCPREDGEDYTKCKTICKQSGHAEEMALKHARGTDLTGSTAYIKGIKHYCKSCQIQLFDAGVLNLRRMD